MSFDVFLIESSASPEGVEAAAATDRALALCGARRGGAGEFDFVLASGSDVEFFTSDDGTSGGMFATRGLSDELVNLIFELADATQCFIVFPADEPALLRTLGNVGEIADDRMDTIDVADAHELRARLDGSFGAWADYAGQVTGAEPSAEAERPADPSLLDRFFKRSDKDE